MQGSVPQAEANLIVTPNNTHGVNAGSCSINSLYNVKKGEFRTKQGELVSIWMTSTSYNYIDPLWKEFNHFVKESDWTIVEAPNENTKANFNANGLLNLSMADVKVMHLADWCKGNDSAKAEKICPKKADAVASVISKDVPMMHHQGQYSWMMDHCMTAKQKATNCFCKDHEIWKSILMI